MLHEVILSVLGKSVEKRTPRRHMRTWGDNIEIYLQ